MKLSSISSINFGNEKTQEIKAENKTATNEKLKSANQKIDEFVSNIPEKNKNIAMSAGAALGMFSAFAAGRSKSFLKGTIGVVVSALSLGATLLLATVGNKNSKVVEKNGSKPQEEPKTEVKADDSVESQPIVFNEPTADASKTEKNPAAPKIVEAEPAKVEDKTDDNGPKPVEENQTLVAGPSIQQYMDSLKK